MWLPAKYPNYDPRMGIFDKILRAGEGKKLKALQALVPDINALEPEIEAAVRRRAAGQDRRVPPAARQRRGPRRPADRGLRRRPRGGQPGHRPAPLRRPADGRRRPALRLGRRDEDRRGQDPRLTLPVYLNGLAGKGVHLITVNDYLARRDAEWMGQRPPLARASTVGLDRPRRSTTPTHKRAQYACDITYGTNNEFGFDYLRDNMAMTLADKVQRGHNYAIVDEVDSILIDEARTPLIISGRVADAAKLYYKFASIVRGLKRDDDYEVDEEKRIVVAARGGHREGRAGARRREPLRRGAAEPRAPASRPRCKAKELFKRDKDYIVQHGEVKIVDEFTGRILEGRRWSEGLHQAVEAKEGVKIKEENQTLATITLQNYFRMYDKLAGMTGTAVTEAAEFANTYEPPGRADPDATARASASTRPTSSTRPRTAKFERRRRRHRRALRDRPAGARRHHLGGEVREAVAPARQAGHPPRGAQRQAAHP